MSGNTDWLSRGARVVPPPRDRFLLEQGNEEVELFLEQGLVSSEVVAEQGKRLGEGAAPEDHVGSSLRDRVEGCKPLKHANRIVRTQHRDGRAEPDPTRACRDGAQQHFGRGDGEIGAVMFADADEIDPEFVGEHTLFDNVAEHLRIRLLRAVVVRRHVSERIEAQFERFGHVPIDPPVERLP